MNPWPEFGEVAPETEHDTEHETEHESNQQLEQPLKQSIAENVKETSRRLSSISVKVSAIEQSAARKVEDALRTANSICDASQTGLKQHATHLHKSWPLWGRPKRDSEAPGAGLVLRETLLLCFLNAAALLGQLHLPAAHESVVLPILREGLCLALVLFGAQHPLALKIVNAFQRASKALIQYQPSAVPLTTHPATRVDGSYSRSSTPRQRKRTVDIPPSIASNLASPQRRVLQSLPQSMLRASPGADDSPRLCRSGARRPSSGGHTVESNSPCSMTEFVKSQAALASTMSSQSHVQDFFTAQQIWGSHAGQTRLIPKPLVRPSDTKLYRPIKGREDAGKRPSSAPGSSCIPSTKRRSGEVGRVDSPPGSARPSEACTAPRAPAVQQKHRHRPMTASMRPRSPVFTSGVLGKGHNVRPQLRENRQSPAATGECGAAG